MTSAAQYGRPETLGDDVLESCLYLLREKLRTP